MKRKERPPSRESGLTYRPSPEIRRILEDIQAKTGISLAKQVDYAVLAWLDTDTDATIQLYRLRREASNG